MCMEPEADMDVYLYYCQPGFWDKVSSLQVELSDWARVAGICLSPIFLPPLLWSYLHGDGNANSVLDACILGSLPGEPSLDPLDWETHCFIVLS